MTMPEGQKWDYATRPEVEGCREGSWGLLSWSKKLQASCRLLSKPLHTVISRDIYQALVTWVLMNWHWHTLQEDSEQVDLADDTTAQQAAQVILFQKYFYFRQLTQKMTSWFDRNSTFVVFCLHLPSECGTQNNKCRISVKSRCHFLC